MKTVINNLQNKTKTERIDKNINHISQINKLEKEKQKNKIKDKIKELIKNERKTIDVNAVYDRTAILKNDVEKKIKVTRTGSLFDKPNKDRFKPLFSQQANTEDKKIYTDTLKGSKLSTVDENDFGNVYNSNKKNDYSLKIKKDVFKKK